MFSEQLQNKIDPILKRRNSISLGRIHFDSPLLLAPMSAICNVPFRLLMEKLGAGGTVSELISCHGIQHRNDRTLHMLKIDPREKNIGIQIFGEDKNAMSYAAAFAQDFGPKFIDINMGCPVRKVVSKGGGSALLQDTSKLGDFFSTIKKEIQIPLTIKIRTGWDEASINAHEIIHIAKEEGIEFVAVHGRTRTQQYKGQANWNYLETLAQLSPLPIIGNGDLHSAKVTRQRLIQTSCQALMLGRGPLRNPFIFLESFLSEQEVSPFGPRDYLEIIECLLELTKEYAFKERAVLVQMRKHIVWFAAGLKNVAIFRNDLFKAPDLKETMRITRDYFMSLGDNAFKKINYDESFMSSGHG